MQLLYHRRLWLEKGGGTTAGHRGHCRCSRLQIGVSVAWKKVPGPFPRLAVPDGIKPIKPLLLASSMPGTQLPHHTPHTARGFRCLVSGATVDTALHGRGMVHAVLGTLCWFFPRRPGRCTKRIVALLTVRQATISCLTCRWDGTTAEMSPYASLYWDTPLCA